MTTTPLTDQQLADIRTRRHLATGSTWYLQPTHGPNFVAAEHHGYEHGIGTLDFGVGDQADADREFVLNAHDDITALLIQLDRYQALDLGDLDGRISASCDNGDHPTWLRRPDDTRGCPWCEVDRLRAELATARAQACDCFAATFHANTCQHAVITWNGTTYNTGHWLIDRDGVPWMPHSLANGMTGELLLLCNGDYSNEPSPISDVLDEWGPLTASDPVDHSKSLAAAGES